MRSERVSGREQRASRRATVVTVRPATRADLDRIAEIEQQAFSDAWSRRSFEGLLGDHRVYFCVATVAGRVEGYVVAWFVAGEGELANLAVASDARRRGVGAALLDAAIDAGRERSIGSLYLEVRDSNVGARTLYASRGFATVGRRRGYYRKPVEDALVLRLVLPTP
jgi:ribosomal-protein-alanine N-acetyltransferase